MGAGRLFTMLVVLILSFIGMIFLETKMERFFALELVIIVVGVLLAIIALLGMASESRWAYPFTTILFALLLANTIFLFVITDAIGTFLIMLVLNLFGFLMSVLSIEDISRNAAGTFTPEMTPPAENYAAEPEAKVTYTAPKAKKSRRRRRKK